MKTAYQTQALITSQTIQNHNDWELIQSFCQKRHIRLGTFSPTIEEGGMTIAQFLDWYDNGYGNGEIARYNGKTAIILEGNCEYAVVGGTISSKGYEEKMCMAFDNYGLKKLSISSQEKANRTLASLGYEFSRKTNEVVPKYVPHPNEKVFFYNLTDSGVGVVKSVDASTNRIDLYCWFNYVTKEIGYSMHEEGIVTLDAYHFEPISITANNRLKSELAKVGKRWFDKLHRIEPIEVKAEVDQKYWYINDKLKVIQGVEKGTPTSHFRYLVGNYFTKYSEAIEYHDKILELLKDRLAK